MEHPELDAFIASLPIAYSAAFVPKSQSRNRDEKAPSINWRVSLVRTIAARLDTEAARLDTDYTQGIGHVPGYNSLARRFGTGGQYAEMAKMAETGLYLQAGAIRAHARLPVPLLRDVLYSLVTDAALGDEPFAEFCADLGYDEDSRKAEACWRKCVETRFALRGLLGAETLERLREMFQDY